MTAAAAAGALVAVAVVRLAVYGFGLISPDAAMYLYSGRSVWDLDLPRAPGGGFFAARAPAFGAMLNAGRFTAEPLTSARVIAFVAACTLLVVTVVLSARIGGVVAGIATALALLAYASVWAWIPSLVVDIPQALGVVVTVWCLSRATLWRFVIAGVVLGVTVLVKETALVLVVLPLAWIGVSNRRELVRGYAAYLGALALTISGWWILVWVQLHQLFPLNSLSSAVERAARDRVTAPTFVAGFAVALAAWVFIARLWSDVRMRLLMIAAAAFLPLSAYSWLRGFTDRQQLVLGVLSTIAVGVAVAHLYERSARGAVALAVVLALAAVVVHVSPASRAAPDSSDLTDEAAAWLAPRLAETPHARVLMSFRDRTLLAYRLADTARVAPLPTVKNGQECVAVWAALGDRYCVPRDQFTRDLARPDTRFIVLSGPHPLTPTAYAMKLERGARDDVRFETSFRRGSRWLSIFSVDHTAETGRAGR